MSNSEKMKAVEQQDVKGFVDRLLEDPMTEETRYLAKRLMGFLYSWLGVSLATFFSVFVLIYIYGIREISTLIIWGVVAAIPWFIVSAILIFKYMMKMEGRIRKRYRDSISKEA